MNARGMRRLASGARRRTRRAADELLGRGPSTGGALADERGRLEEDVRLLVGSVLFDHAWYARQTAAPDGREAAARHYLTLARDGSRPHPHPLFDPEFYRLQLGPEQTVRLEEEGCDPFVFYLRHRTWRRATHPLFDARAYVRRNPEAHQYDGGPLAHYAQVGRTLGRQANDWLPAEAEGRYPDAIAYLEARVDEGTARRDRARKRSARRHDPNEEQAFLAGLAGAADPLPGGGVSVLLDAGFDAARFETTLRSLAAQTDRRFEVFVLGRESAPEVAELARVHLPDAVAGVALSSQDDLAAVTGEQLAAARHPHVAFAQAGDEWTPERVRILLAAAASSDSPARVYADVLGLRRADGSVRQARAVWHETGLRSPGDVSPSQVMMERSLVAELGGVDPTLRNHWLFDLLLRASQRTAAEIIPVVAVSREAERANVNRGMPGSQRRPVEHTVIPSWSNVVLNKRLIDWDDLATRAQDPDLVSVIIPTYHDWQMTAAAVETVLASDGHDGIRVECIVWDNGSSPAVAAILDALQARFPQLVLVHSDVNHGFALGNNLALPHAHGATVMFLNNDTTVDPDWLVPVVRELRKDEVLGVQSLLVYPSGAVQSAGVVFPTTGGLPHPFLQGFPVEDSVGIDALPFRALTGAALAVRFSDAVALRGFDPIFTNGQEDVDLCLRLGAAREGVFRVVTDSPVVHYESRSPGRYERTIDNRRLYLDRWAGVSEPRDDADLWRAQGFEVVGHELARLGSHVERRLMVPMPVLTRRPHVQVDERFPRLRWAIKNPAPAGPVGLAWGDTHFAAALAAALREHGQHVAIDRRPEFERVTSHHDDVVLVLRGVAPYNPSPENVTITWVISHPEMVGRSHLMTSDRVVAASEAWAASTSAAWGVPIEPLLQATDPALFHPDRAVPDTGHPVLFVGGSRKVYRAIVRDAVEAGLPLSVYGQGWKPFIDRRFVKGEYFPNEELGAGYRSAGVVLNDHWDEMRDEGFISNRLFDAVAAGARVVTDDVAGLDHVFGDSVQVYRSPSDLVRLTSLADPDAVFGDDEYRRSEAARIHREHSFSARAERLVEIAMEARRSRGLDR